MTSTVEDQPLPGDQEAIISRMILFILDQLDQTVKTPDPHYQYLRAIFQRYPLHVVIMEMRNILALLYFPQAADLSHLVMEHAGVMLVPQQRPGGYCTTFTYDAAFYSTPLTATPLNSLELAQHMVDQLRAGVELSASPLEDSGKLDGVGSEEKEGLEEGMISKDVVEATPALDMPSSPSFIRIGRMTLSIDKILYIKDDSSERYRSVRVGLAGGVDMRLDANPSNNYIHTQEVRFIGEEARALLEWHHRWTITLLAPSGAQEERSNHEHSRL